MIHWYDLLDFNQCTRLITESSSTVDNSLLAMRKAFNNRIDPGEWLRTRKQERQRLKEEKEDKRKIDFSYTFVGDERLYMIYRTFINTIKYRSNLSRKKSATHKVDKPETKPTHKTSPFVYKHAKNLTYTDENFILQYYSLQTFNDYLYNLLYSWSTNTSIRPHVLIFGFGLYDGIRENASTESIKSFEGNLTRVKQFLLSNFSSSTTVLWLGQPRLALNEHLFRFSSHSLYQQNEYLSEFIPKINSYIDRMNSIARRVFYNTNIYWHSSTLLEEYSSLSNENTFLYDDSNDDYFEMNASVNDNYEDANEEPEHESSAQIPSTATSTITTTSSSINPATANLSSIFQFDAEENSPNQTEAIFYSYVPLRKNHTVLSTPMINSGKIHEFYKLSSFTRHTCVQILLNALCNPLLLPDDGTCCAQVPPLTRLQFLISLILGCSITFFIIYIVYRIRSVFILKRKRSSKLSYGKLINHDEPTDSPGPHEKNATSNGHCHMNGAYSKEVNDEGDEANQTLLSATTDVGDSTK